MSMNFPAAIFPATSFRRSREAVSKAVLLLFLSFPMSRKSMIISYGGSWVDNKYEGGERRFALVPTNGYTYDTLMRQIECIVRADKNTYDYVLNSLVESSEGELIMNISNDDDVKFIMDANEVPKFYIIITPKMTQSTSCVMEQPVSNLGFVHLLNAQNVASQLHANVMPHVAHNVNVAQGHILSDTVNIESENERSNEWIYDNDDVAEDDDGDDVDTDYDVGDDADIDYDVGDYVDIDYDDGDDVDSLDEDNDDVVEDVVHAMSNRHNVQPLGSSSVSDIVEGDDLQYHSTRGRQWVIPGAVYQDTFSCDNVGVTDLYRREALSPGCTYADKEKLQIALGLYHLNNPVDYVVERSNKKRFAAVCRDKEKCTFLMRATSVGTGSVWRVSKWNAPHTCEMDLRKHGRRTVGAKVIGAFFAPTLLNEGAILRPKEMLAQLQRQFGIQVDYKTALMGRNYAVSMIYGDTDRSFQQLPSYLFMVQQANPGTVVELQTDSSNCFQYVFMALSASISGFLASGRPVIVVDGTHLKGKYKGIMFVAATKDGNEQIFPLAVGIGDKENDNSWTWFFRQLRKTFGCPDHLLFISDQHRSIKNAVEVVYPGIPHGLCTYHLQKNLSRYGVHVVSMFQKCARCYRSPEFDIHFSNLSSTCDGAYRRLVEVEPRRWARSQCPVRRYEFLTSNCAESFNSRLRWARRLPICTLMEFVRSLIGHWVVERREKALSRTHELTDYATKKLERSLEEGRTMAVEAINSMKFKVSEGTKHYIVDLNERSCSCREFDMDLIPCSHAAAAISKLKLSCIAFVSTYYTTQTLREMYAAEVIPVLHSDEWCVPFEVQSRVVGVPINPTQSGRPRTSRIDSSSQSRTSRIDSSSEKRKSVCSRCNKSGHYRVRCTEILPIPEEPSIVEDDTATVGSRRRKRCGNCHEEGHTRLRCPKLTNEQV